MAHTGTRHHSDSTVPGYTYIGQVHHFAYTIIVIVPSYTYTGVNIFENLICEKKMKRVKEK
jgi:hypothetical protein